MSMDAYANLPIQKLLTACESALVSYQAEYSKRGANLSLPAATDIYQRTVGNLPQIIALAKAALASGETKMHVSVQLFSHVSRWYKL
jgi:hypothetical protein